MRIDKSLQNLVPPKFDMASIQTYVWQFKSLDSLRFSGRWDSPLVSLLYRREKMEVSIHGEM
jgi:hypothetical protein